MLKVEAPTGAREILLHACCAPCSGAILECLRDNGIAPVVFFSNSNIWPREEYDLRLSELRRYAALMGVELVEDAYDHAAWREAVRGLEDEPERGRRCAACFRFRLARAARYAASRGLPVLATTLASSRWKDLDQVNEAGESVCTAVAASFRGSQPPETSGCAGPLPMEYGGISPEPPAALKSLSDFAKCKVPGPGRSADADLSAAGPSLLRSCPEGKVPPNRGLQGFEDKPACWLRFPEAAAVSTTPATADSAAPASLPSVVFWSQNWRKGGLQPRRNEIVREQCFYNQNWCGCEFSKRQTL